MILTFDFDISVELLASQFDPSSKDSIFWNLNSINAVDAWDFSRCCGEVSVAVLDSGIDFNHPDLKMNIDREHAWDVVSNKPLIGDLLGHGTEVAGVVSARNYNKRGSDGVSYNAKIVPINIATKVLVDPEKDIWRVESDFAVMAKGINRVINESGIDNLKVVNISYTGFKAPVDGALQDAIDNAYIHGVHVVCSAGNSGKEQRSYPSDMDHVISVSGVSRNDDAARWQKSTYGSGKDISAPAENILVPLPNGRYASSDGTSFAAPMVSGALALMYAANPNLTVIDAEHALFSSATDIGPHGFDKEFGWGRLNAGAAVRSVVETEGRIPIFSGELRGVPSKVFYGATEPTVSPEVSILGETLREGVDYKVIRQYPFEPESMKEITIKGIGRYYGVLGKGISIENHWKRLGGIDALQTSVRISFEGFGSNPPDTVILATLEGYYDALTASALAGKLNCPVFLTAPEKVPIETLNVLSEIRPKKVIIMGGTVSVSEEVEREVAREISSIEEVERIAGDNAVDTANMVFEKGEALGGWGKTALVATLSTYHDALSGSPYAFADAAPIFLCDWDNSLNAETVARIRNGGFDRVLILGGTLAVDSCVETQLSGLEVRRLFGGDAHKTSVEIANFWLSEGASLDGIGVATSASYYDALSGSYLCGGHNAPLILTASENPSDLLAFVEDNRASIGQGYILGGTSTLSSELEETLNRALF